MRWKEGELDEPLQKAVTATACFPSSAFIVWDVCAWREGALLELAVVNHVESRSSRGCWAGTNEAVKMTGPRGTQGISWCSVGSLPGMHWEGRSLGRKADSWNIWWLHLERKKQQHWSCCLVPKSCASEGPGDSRVNIGSPVSWHLVIWKKAFIRNQIIGT